jgi:hypothetical protein
MTTPGPSETICTKPASYEILASLGSGRSEAKLARDTKLERSRFLD